MICFSLNRLCRKLFTTPNFSSTLRFVPSAFVTFALTTRIVLDKCTWIFSAWREESDWITVWYARNRLMIYPTSFSKLTCVGGTENISNSDFVHSRHLEWTKFVFIRTWLLFELFSRFLVGLLLVADTDAILLLFGFHFLVDLLLAADADAFLFLFVCLTRFCLPLRVWLSLSSPPSLVHMAHKSLYRSLKEFQCPRML